MASQPIERHIPPMDPVRVAVIGCGNFARLQHLPNLMRLREADLVAVCDQDTGVAAAAATQFRAKRACTDAESVLSDPAIEAVVIAVRDHLQADLAIRALRAGKHVYVEKPVATNPIACAEVVAAQKASGRRVAVGFQKRFAPIYRRVAQVIAGDGGLRNAHLNMTDDAWRWAIGYAPGSLLGHDLCHLFDLLRFLTKSEATSVYCAASRPDDDALLLTFASGCVATITGSGHGTMDMPKERFDGICTRGGFSALDFVELRTFGYRDFPASECFAGHTHPAGDFLHRPLLAKQGAEGLDTIRRIAWELRNQTPHDDPYAQEAQRFADQTLPNFLRDQGWMTAMAEFLRGIRTGADTDHADPGDAFASAAITEAAQRSRETGSVVHLAAMAHSQS